MLNYHLILFLVIVGSLATLFILNIVTYKNDKEVIAEYFNNKEETIIDIKKSSEFFFKNKEKLKKIRADNKFKNLIIIAKNGPLIIENFYTVTTSKDELIELYVTNSVMFFLKPRVYENNNYENDKTAH